ncbi:MAG: DUF1957 domain-containing protein [Elusimicrobia bacterium]|nr:DUF1957 domain-containing protein [Elusimicrobiota bacterium]
MTKGSILFLLHAHLPYINHPRHDETLEENWFFEAVVETYVPLISLLERLSVEGIRPALTLSISPTLGAMLENEILEKKLARYIESRIEFLEKESERVSQDSRLSKTVEAYRQLYNQAAELVYKYSADLITPLKRFQHTGQIEIITTSATHAILPLMIQPEVIRAQIAVAGDDYADRFNVKSNGFWLPECGYDARLQTYLKNSGFDYIFTESHSFDKSVPAPQPGVYAPAKTLNGIHLFARDSKSSMEVWSSKFGYPGAPEYREFYRDIGYDSDCEYIKPCLGADGQKRPIGIKYHRITGNVELSSKEYYDPEEAALLAGRHADDFIRRRVEQADEIYSSKNVRPLIVECFDAELFGHWWFEGPMFLENVIRKIRQDRPGLQFVTPGEFLNSCNEPEALNPGMSSWGERGYFDPWLNESNDWIYPELAQTAEKIINAANRFRNQDINHATARALNQAAREVLLSQASDWPFLIYINSHPEYAASRIKTHCSNAEQLISQAIEKKIDENFLARLEEENNVFQRIDFRIFSSISRF